MSVGTTLTDAIVRTLLPKFYFLFVLGPCRPPGEFRVSHCFTTISFSACRLVMLAERLGSRGGALACSSHAEILDEQVGSEKDDLSWGLASTAR